MLTTRLTANNYAFLRTLIILVVFLLGEVFVLQYVFRWNAWEELPPQKQIEAPYSTKDKSALLRSLLNSHGTNPDLQSQYLSIIEESFPELTRNLAKSASTTEKSEETCPPCPICPEIEIDSSSYTNQLISSKISWDSISTSNVSLFINKNISILSPGRYWDPRGYQTHSDALPQILWSKAFTNIIQPTRVFPFAFRATYNPPFADLSMTTSLTVDRLDRLEQFLEGLPISVSAALHISETANITQIMEHLGERIHKTPLLKKYVDLHVIIDSFELRLNYWRNVARLYARTEFIYQNDVDFMASSTLRDSIMRPDRVEMLRKGATFVVIAFDGEDVYPLTDGKCPRDKTEAMKYKDQFRQFSKHNESQHLSDHKNWWNAKEHYPVRDEWVTKKGYVHFYEPWTVHSTLVAPWYDERFEYGRDKNALLAQLFMNGMDFYVLPDAFMLHRPHPPESAPKKKNNKYQYALYDNMRTELCLSHYELNPAVRAAPKVGERLRNYCTAKIKQDRNQWKFGGTLGK